GRARGGPPPPCPLRSGACSPAPPRARRCPTACRTAAARRPRRSTARATPRSPASGASWPALARRSLGGGGGGGRRQPGLDLLLEAPDEAIREFRCVAPRAKRILPLRVGERLQPRADPRHVRGRDVLEQDAVPAAPLELDVRFLHPDDERRLLEDLHV